MRATKRATAKLTDNPISMSHPDDALLAETRRVPSGVGDGIRAAEGREEGVTVGVKAGAIVSAAGAWITFTVGDGVTTSVGVPGGTMATPGVSGGVMAFIGVSVGKATAPSVGEGKPLGMGVPVSVTTPVGIGVARVTRACLCAAPLTVTFPASTATG